MTSVLGRETSEKSELTPPYLASFACFALTQREALPCFAYFASFALSRSR
jgi:hypothetical protein